jgi:zinc-ribbon domain
MMYHNRLAMAVKVNGKVLREFKDTVFLPFGAEYSLLIKNLHTVRALVRISIDGNEVVDGGLIVDYNSEIELERMVKTNLNEGNRFKFIERSDAVEQHRGVKLEDGIIRVEYQFEDRSFYRPPTLTYTAQPYWTNDILVGSDISHTVSTNSVLRNAIHDMQCSATSSVHPGVACNDFVETGYNDAGITVPGSVSNQKFSKVTGFRVLPDQHVMIFKLLGETPDNEPIRKPVTVKAKPKCVTCGKQNKAHAKFCSHCGTALTVFA